VPKLSKEQAEQLAELERLRDEPDEPDEPQGDGDDGHVIVLRGTRADAFLERLMGPAPAPAGKPPVKKTPPGNRKSAPAGTQGDPEGEPEGDPEGDPEPERKHRYFR
jgi:hypothetical protein